ncbi:MAG: nicotinate-nucleotide diphosphorylase (carboxylating), partial [Bacteroidales bacterium]|nr:nicotinate-nucleotide diphosphorylase (carboxylating) [Bacteroidales bacterium]
MSCIDKSEQGKARLLVKQNGIIAGVEVAKAVCNYLSKDLKLNIFIHDGTPVKVGDIVFELSGPQHDILSAERTILNFMQRMSGIATVTAEYVKQMEGL